MTRAGRRLAAPVFATLALALLVGTGHAADTPGEIVIPVRRGDTLERIAAERLEPGRDWRDLATLNGFTEPRRLRPGQPVRIPWAWLRLIPAEARLGASQGTVRIDRAGGGTEGLGEGSRIRTGERGIVELTLPDGTRLRIPPASSVRIERLRRYYRSNAVDARIRIDGGRIEAESPATPPPGGERRIEIESPKATAAVRGTVFRVGESPSRSVSEVLRGTVDWRAPAGGLQLQAGYGSSAGRDGRVSPPEALPPPPDLSRWPARVGSVHVALTFAPIARARSYRVRVSEGATDGPVLFERTVDSPRIEFDSRNDGPHRIRVRSILASGVEGVDARHVIGIAARPVAPRPTPPEAGAARYRANVDLDWSASPGVVGYRVQVATDPAFANTVADARTAATSWRFLRPGQPPGSSRHYYWRVAAIDPSGQGPYSPALRFETRSIPAAPNLASPAGSPTPTDGRARTVAWAPVDAAGYEIELAAGTDFSRPILHRRVDAPRVALPRLAPGSYRLRVRAIDADGATGPYSVPAALEVAPTVRGGSGEPVQSGGGPLLGATD